MIRKILISLILLGAGLLLLNSCGKTSSDEIMTMYSSYNTLPSSENRIGIYISYHTEMEDEQTINIEFSNDLVNQNEDNCMILASRCHLVDAEDPEVQIETRLLSGSTTTTTNTGISTTSY